MPIIVMFNQFKNNELQYNRGNYTYNHQAATFNLNKENSKKSLFINEANHDYTSDRKIIRAKNDLNVNDAGKGVENFIDLDNILNNDNFIIEDEKEEHPKEADRSFEAVSSNIKKNIYDRFIIRRNSLNE